MEPETERNAAARAPRRHRSDGERSRSTILREATRLATLEGLEGLSIGRLADAVGMSKSGLFAHFGSKEELQLATIETASELFATHVIEPAATATSGIERLQRLLENFLHHLQDEVFPGGCFFASVVAEMDTRPGPVRDRAVRTSEEWFAHLVEAVRDAQAEGSLSSAEDPVQLAFELEAFLLLANALYVESKARAPLDRARVALARRLARAAP